MTSFQGRCMYTGHEQSMNRQSMAIDNNRYQLID